MTEFKVGDRVIIVDLYELCKTSYYPLGVIEAMKKMSGMEADIMKICTDAYTPSRHRNSAHLDGALYKIDIDKGKYSWANIMFKPKKGNLIVVDEEL